MKAAYPILVAVCLASGCVHAPETWTGGGKPPTPAAQAQTQATSAKPVQPDDVTEANAHAVARALRKEMDREEQKLRSDG